MTLFVKIIKMLLEMTTVEEDTVDSYVALIFRSKIKFGRVKKGDILMTINIPHPAMKSVVDVLA